MRKIFTWGLWLLLGAVIIAAAVFAYRTLRGSDAPEEGTTVTLTCNDECANRAQCGVTMASPRVPVILAGRNAPVVERDQHDVVFPNGATAEVRESIQVDLEDAEGNQFQHPFSRVEFRNPMNDIVTGWVADWCIERP